jgi:two-component sensor histidine kinase
MPKGPAKAKAGLGTGIVEALAAQLHASLAVTDNQPGTMVTLVHAESAAASAAGPPAV